MNTAGRSVQADEESIVHAQIATIISGLLIQIRFIVMKDAL